MLKALTQDSILVVSTSQRITTVLCILYFIGDADDALSIPKVKNQIRLWY